MSQTTIFELLGITGISIGVVAYVPQVVHLAREHCSAGVSGRAWAMWLTSSLLIGALARPALGRVVELVLHDPNKPEPGAVLAAVLDCGTNGLVRARLIDSTQYGVHLTLLPWVCISFVGHCGVGHGEGA